MNLTRRRTLTALAGVAALPLLAACPGGGAEDCDAEDRRTGDEDCDDADGRKRRKTKPKTKTGGKRK